MTKEEAIAKYGIDPETIGLRHRGWWIVGKIEDEEEQGNAQLGDLCVKARDGGSNQVDVNAFRVGQCVGSSQDGFDCTYRYYFYRAIGGANEPA